MYRAFQNIILGFSTPFVVFEWNLIRQLLYLYGETFSAWI